MQPLTLNKSNQKQVKRAHRAWSDKSLKPVRNAYVPSGQAPKGSYLLVIKKFFLKSLFMHFFALFLAFSFGAFFFNLADDGSSFFKTSKTIFGSLMVLGCLAAPGYLIIKEIPIKAKENKIRSPLKVSLVSALFFLSGALLIFTIGFSLFQAFREVLILTIYGFYLVLNLLPIMVLTNQRVRNQVFDEQADVYLDEKTLFFINNKSARKALQSLGEWNMASLNGLAVKDPSTRIRTEVIALSHPKSDLYFLNLWMKGTDLLNGKINRLIFSAKIHKKHLEDLEGIVARLE